MGVPRVLAAPMKLEPLSPWESSSVDETLKAQHEGSCAEVFCAIYVHCFGAHTNKEAGISFD